MTMKNQTTSPQSLENPTNSSPLAKIRWNIRDAASKLKKSWSEWQDLNLRPLVPNEVYSYLSFEILAIFVTFAAV
jgi:hypothetical protein